MHGATVRHEEAEREVRARAKVLTGPAVIDRTPFAQIVSSAISLVSSHRRVAKRLGLSHGLIGQWCRGDRPLGDGNLARLLKAGEVGRELYRQIGSLVTEPIAISGDPERRCLYLGGSFGRINQGMVEASADRVIDRDEARELLADALEHRRETDRLIAELEALAR